MDKVNLSTFPSTRAEALALEYAKSKLTETTTPEKFAENYLVAYEKIKDQISKLRQGVTP